MSDNSRIEWTDATWNPVTGCTKVSPGCDHCYAERVTERFHGPSSFATVKLHPDRLEQPLRWKRPRMVFVNSMSDLFHDDVPDLFLTQVFDVMEQAKQHTFQLLTKRHARMRAFVRAREATKAEYAAKFDLCPTEAMRNSPAAQYARHRAANPPANIWLGVSVETQQWADIRIPALLDTPASVRWLSCEPLLGAVDLFNHLFPTPCPRGCGCRWPEDADWRDCGCSGPCCTDEWKPSPGIDWVVAGGESGPSARPMHPDWARGLRDTCVDAGVPFFFKQFGEYGELPVRSADRGVSVANDGTVYLPGELSWPDGPRVGEAVRARHDKAHLHQMYRVGKKAAGRELDGRTWDQYPPAADIRTPGWTGQETA